MINHPLVKKEWKSLKWVMLLYGCIFAFFALIVSDNMAEEKTSRLLMQYREAVFANQLYAIGRLMVPILLISMMIVVGVLFIYDRNIHIGKFITSLPYTRKEQFKIKYLMGLTTFTVPLVFFTGALYSIREHHQGWISRGYQYAALGKLLKAQDSVGILILWITLLWLMMLMVYSFLMMIQTLIGQNIVASIIGGIIFIVPLFLAYAIPTNLSLLSINIGGFSHIERVTREISVFLYGNPVFKYMGNIRVLDGYTLFESYTNLYGAYDYQWYLLYIAVLILGIIICTLLGYYFIQYNDVGKNGEIALYPWVKRFLVIGTTLCSLLLLPMIIRLFTGIENPIITLISMVIGAILGYFISCKSIEMTAKHE